jgi:hypothetical protein
LFDTRVSGFVNGKDLDYHCCEYLSNEEKRPNQYKLVINFLDHDAKKRLAATLDLDTLQVEKTQVSDLTRSDVPPIK